MSSDSKNGPGPIPPRWLHCPRKASQLIGEKFLPFKTPLSKKYDDQVPEEFRFPPKMLFNSMKSYKVKIGLWIDLTFTSRFYDKQEVEEEGCRYVKLQCRGHKETPSEDQTKAFILVCQQFISQHPLEVIGIHCTHGFNRTGFLIVSYLVENMDWSVEAAINEFARIRPPGIYKADYLNELCRRYDDLNFAPLPPELPMWHKEFDDGAVDDDGNALDVQSDSNNSNDRGGGKRRRKGNIRKRPAIFMEGVNRGISVVYAAEKLSAIQKKVQALTNFCGEAGDGFPGCQPVSMDNNNLSLLQKMPYKVSWKADGTRYMMLISGENQVYFVDRDNNVFQVEGLRFPHRKDPNRHLSATLLDGEMVIDKVNGQDIPRYLVYDIIHYEGQDVGKSPFTLRLTCIEWEIIGPRRECMKTGLIDRDSEPFSVRLKEFWDVTQAGSLLSDKFAEQLSHEPDGLIFQPAKEPYIPGRCMEVLKWKPASHNSVDFLLKIVMEEGEGIVPRKIGQLFVGGYSQPFALMKVSKAIKELNGKIIECKFQDKQWVFMRERTDKSFPNSLRTAQAVWNSILDPVTSERLLEFIHRHRWRHKDPDLMPPPSKVPRR
ncbi:mRNA-capping enzyme [Hetaerina americana]|uniref:mRNA-capping enzyme n=1 Tax=Hetaerina americana TaxID=62018 RepID=UPI003A7F1DF6